MLGDPVRERLRELERPQLVGLAAVALLVVAGAAFWYVRSLPATVRVETSAGAVSAPRSPSPSPEAATIVVYVSGWVRNPGVYEFHQGDRVVDALARAGGARPGADLTGINLAALLADAEQIVVVKKGRATPPGTLGAGPAGSSVSGAGGGTPAPVNINTATLDQLESLPGIGPALGQRIIDYRELHGPFGTVEDLLNVSGIGDQRLADIRPLVTV